jgi:hypothetical protein
VYALWFTDVTNRVPNPTTADPDIPRATRQAITDEMASSGTIWCGSLDEVQFLSRIWDLSSLPTTDTRFKDAEGDIWQHCINSNDWGIDWIYGDALFDLLDGEPTVFLQFLAQCVHPRVRRDADETERLVRFFNDCLRPVGYELVVSDSLPSLSGPSRSVYEPRALISMRATFELAKYDRLSEPRVLSDYLRRIDDDVLTDPPAAIAASKELVESLFKQILADFDEIYAPADDLLRLYRQVSRVLRLNVEAVPTHVRGSQASQRALPSLVGVVQGLAELRNEIGLGHGQPTLNLALARHARLSGTAARAVTEFLLDTWHVRKQQERN